ncbi:MAG: SDR family NAD(P)-dependent oxidoreductase, partial [Vicinamibacterales bacterium]
MDLQLKNKVILIAGASKGLGYAVARSVAEEGAIVSISSRDQASITSAASRIERETGSPVFAMPVDVRSKAALEKWIAATADKFGGIDGLMTNSGGPPAGLAISFDDAAWQDAADLLLFSTIRMVRATVPHMKT